MAIYRITFTGGPTSDTYKSYDVSANDSTEAFSMAYKMPEAKQRWKYTDVSVMEVEKGPHIYGICFVSLYRSHTYSQCMFIRADNEDQARRFYTKNIEGKSYFGRDPGKPDDNGDCVYGAIRYSYYATANRYDFDAT